MTQSNAVMIFLNIIAETKILKQQILHEMFTDFQNSCTLICFQTTKELIN